MARNCPGDAKNRIPLVNSAPMAPHNPLVAAMMRQKIVMEMTRKKIMAVVAAMGMSPSCVIGSGTESDEDD